MDALQLWLRQQLPAAGALAPVSGDAGFRRYFRTHDTASGRSLVVMDASADKASCLPFTFIDELLCDHGLRAPQIVARDLDQGYLLLEDLGADTYLDVLNGSAQGADAVDRLYTAAIDALVQLQNIPCPEHLPCYDEALLRRELALFPDWYLQKHLQIAVDGELRQRLDAIFDVLVKKALAQPRVLVLRDYMPRNLMPGDTDDPRPGLLDFQDAVCGPVSYDPICLFKDAFISWPEARVVSWLEQYWQRARSAGLAVPAQFTAFYADCDFMGVQRHLKVIGIFARLCHRDGKPKYLDDVPRFFDYLRGACARRAELAPLLALLDEIAPAKVSA
jgi:aminoglycoside/choline kinase family phosphotransferase